MNEITMIIPTYNRSETLERTLEVVFRASSPPEEVIIVDQTTKEQVKHRIKELAAMHGCKYVFLCEPSSTKARNVGAAQAQNELLLFMDDDVDVMNNTFNHLRDLFKDNDLAMIGGLDKSAEFHNSKLGAFFLQVVLE